MKITERIALEIVHHESVVREAYKDSKGVWTWSVGLTNASGHNVERYIDNPQSLERCLEVYVWALDKYAEAVREAMPGLTEAQFAAALSFHWNTGAISTAAWVRKWNAGDAAGARKAIMNWKSPASIVPRRRAERALFFDGKWSGSGHTTEWPVTDRHTPDWGKGKRIDIRPALQKAMHIQQPVVETKPQPQEKEKDMAIPGQGQLITRLVALVFGAGAGGFIAGMTPGVEWLAVNGVEGFFIKPEEVLAALVPAAGGGAIWYKMWQHAKRAGGKT